jgi:hypothetical protein
MRHVYTRQTMVAVGVVLVALAALVAWWRGG